MNQDNQFNVEEYPDYVWFEIFLRCDRSTLLSIEETCHLFRNTLNDRFWIAKCLREDVFVPSLEWRQFSKPFTAVEDEASCSTSDEPVQRKSRGEYQFDLKKLYMKNSLNRNLGYPMEKETTLKKLREDFGVLFHFGGNGIQVETKPEGLHNLNSNPAVKSCLETSYRPCHRYFEVDLLKSGIDAAILDYIRPPIVVRELFCCREDCRAYYNIEVQLLGENERFISKYVVGSPRIKCFSKRWEEEEGGREWETVEFIFDNYPSGIRRICIITSGCDTTGWAGYHGAKFTNTEVFVNFPQKPRWCEKLDKYDSESAQGIVRYSPMRDLYQQIHETSEPQPMGCRFSYDSSSSDDWHTDSENEV